MREMFLVARFVLPIMMLLGGLGFTFFKARQEARDRVYPFPVQSVSETLDETGLPVMVFGDKIDNSRHWRLDKNTSVWALDNAEGDEYLRLTAKTAAEGKGTRIHYEVHGPEGQNHNKVEKGLKENSAFIDVFRAALAEQVDAELTQRPFNITNISASAARASLSQIGNIRAAMANAAKQQQQDANDTINGAYERESQR